MNDKQISAQAKFCKRNDLPHFAPHSGICFSCGKNIYEKITIEKAGSELITGCPICNYSFCE